MLVGKTGFLIFRSFFLVCVMVETYYRPVTSPTATAGNLCRQNLLERTYRFVGSGGRPADGAEFFQR